MEDMKEVLVIEGRKKVFFKKTKMYFYRLPGGLLYRKSEEGLLHKRPKEGLRHRKREEDLRHRRPTGGFFLRRPIRILLIQDLKEVFFIEGQ